MEKPFVAGPAGTASRGRLWFGAGIGLFVLGLVLAVAQYALKQLMVPWYAPVLATAGVVLLLMSLRRRPTLVRGAGLALVALGCAFEWYALVVAARLPQYTGPVQVGHEVPAFSALRADGSPFTGEDLKHGPPTALVFYRGHW